MESIKTLREICQKPRLYADTWQGMHICRPISIYITSLFLRLGVSADAATVVFLVCGITGSLLLISANDMIFFAGALLLEISYVLDHVDGEIARYRKQSSLTGVYFDKICHYILHPFAFVCIGVRLYNYNSDPVIFLLALLAGYSVMMIAVSTDTIDNVLYGKVKQMLAAGVTARQAENGKKTNGGSKNVFSTIFSSIHLLCVFPAAMNVIFFVSLFNLFFGADLLPLLIIFYAIAATMVWIARVSVFILQKRVDKEYAQ